MTERGWAPFAEAIPTAAFGGYGMAPGSMRATAVMSHIMQGYQSTMIEWAEQRPPKVKRSATFTIGRDGRIVQHVSIYDPAWTAGIVMEPTWPGLQTDSSGQPVNPNKYLVHIEHEGWSKATPYPYDYIYQTRWPAHMREASVRVQAWVFEELSLVPSALTVIGHYETDSVRRALDPGSAWSKAEVIAELKASAVLPGRATVIARLTRAQTEIAAALALLGNEGNPR